MSFHETQRPRAGAGVRTGGQFVTKAAAESAVELGGAGDVTSAAAAREVTSAIIDLLPGSATHGEDGSALIWAADDSGEQIVARVAGEPSEAGQWRLERGEAGVTSASGLSADAHPAAVAAWLHAARRASDDDLMDYASSVRDDGVTRAVAAHLSGVGVWDEGGGTTIWFGSRKEPGASGDHAYIVPDGQDAGRWQFQIEDTGSQAPAGERIDVVTGDLTVESDPAAVAEWVRDQAETHGSAPYAG